MFIRKWPLQFSATYSVVVLALASCATQHSQAPLTLDQSAAWAVLPFANHSQTPMAGERVESLTVSALRQRLLPEIDRIAPKVAATTTLPLLDDTARFDQAMEQARLQGIVYAVTGSVEEWRYKTGLDGEPAVGITIRVIEIATGKTLWSSSGARSGWSRESLTGNGQKVIGKLLKELLARTSWTPLSMTR